MNKKTIVRLSVFAFACGLFFSAAAQKQSAKDDLTQMVATERAFSRMSEEKGTREAFGAFIAEDGILFRPRAVLGKKWMQEHPLPHSKTRSLLTWEPIFAAISGSGDLGYTTGPWQYKTDIKDAKASAFGNFMTVWKKQANGDWKFVLDLGISNPEPKTILKPQFSEQSTTNFKAIDVKKARLALLNQDREFSRASTDLGAAAAFLLKLTLMCAFIAKIKCRLSDDLPQAAACLHRHWFGLGHRHSLMFRARAIWGTATVRMKCATRRLTRLPRAETTRASGRMSRECGG